MKKFLVILCATLLSFCAVNSANAIPILDQVSLGTNAVFNTHSRNLDWQQEMMVGVGGLLTSIELYVNSGSAWQNDADEFFQTRLTMSITGWSSIDVSLGGLMLDVGDTFVIGVKGINGATFLFGNRFPGLYNPG